MRRWSGAASRFRFGQFTLARVVLRRALVGDSKTGRDMADYSAQVHHKARVALASVLNTSHGGGDHWQYADDLLLKIARHSTPAQRRAIAAAITRVDERVDG
jgi:hypothetical protein